MFDAAAAATASEVASEQVAQEQADAAVSTEASDETTSTETAESQGVLNALATYMPTESRTEVVFVDPTVPNYQELLAGMNPDIEIIMLDAGKDGVQQMASSLEGRTGIDAIHVISHGSSGELHLGTATLSTETMSGQYADKLATIQQSLSEQADILVYGCDFAEGEAGEAAVNRLAELTGADVEASNDQTGSISLGGDWDFEVETGVIETHIAVSAEAQMNWAGLLGTETVKDQFSSTSYSNNNGTQSWSTSWSETDAGGGGASGGDIRVNSSQLRIDTISVGDAISRGVNLSGASSATLSFAYTNSMSSGSSVAVRISTDGGASYQTLSSGTFSSASHTGSGTASFDISSYMSANTKVQFVVTGISGSGGDRLFVDNVQVSYNANSAPTITSNSGGTTASINVAENTTTVTTVAATDADAGQTLTYSIAGGADAAKFTINSSTGQLSFASVPNYEAPTDSGGDNVYDVTIQVSDGAGGTDTQALSINLTNVNEAPTGADATVTINEDTSHTLTTTNFGFSDVDAGDTMSAVRIDTLPAAGILTLSGVAVTAGQVVSVANITAGSLVFTPASNANGTGYANVTFSVRDAASTYDAAPDTLTFTVTAVNDAPTVTNLSGDSLSYSEGDGAVVIEQSGNALVADVDSTNFDTGALTVSIPAGGDSAEDVLSIQNQGTGAGQIGVSGSNVTYGGVTIGTFTGGSSGTHLVVTLNASATPTAVTALVQHITYQDTDMNAPTTGARTIRYALTDGDGGTSANYDTTVTVSGVNDAPVNTVPGAQKVAEDTPLAISGVSVMDVDGNLDAVQLAVGNGTLNLTIVGAASITSGSNGSATLTLSGSQADINATLASLSYQGRANFNGADTLTVTSSDSNGVTDVDTVAITVGAANDVPLFASGGGMVTASFGFGDDYAYNTLLQSDGKIVLAGFASNGKDTDFALVRLNADGTLDAKFGSEGKVLTPIGLSNDQGGFGAVLQSDGKIVVVGHSDNGTDSDVVVLRYNTDGSLDSSFGKDGIVTTDVGGHGELAYGVALQSDGKVVLVGGSNDGKQQDLLVARYDTDGSLDAKFGSGGIVTSNFGSGFSEGIGVVIQPDGSIVVSGASQPATDLDFALVRYSAEGTPDSGFGKGGILTTDFSGGMDIGTRLVMQPEDGKFIVTGYFSKGSDSDYGMVRYNADGTLDGSFGTGGIVTLHQGDGEDQSLSIALLSDGKILVAGNVSIGNTSELVLARYQSDGTLDEKFGVGGIAQQSVGGFNDRGTSLVVQDDGRIVVGGVSLNGADGDFAAVRFNSDGMLDTSFGTSTYVENGTPVVLDSDIRITDIELALVDNFAGSTLMLVRNGGASSQDAFSSTGTLSALAEGDKLAVDGITIGAVTTNSKGTLLLTFNKSATQALVNSAMQKIAYSNSSDAPPASVQVDWTFNDGNTGSQGTGEALTATGRTTVNITAVNDAPTDLALSANSVTENAANGTVVGTVSGTDVDAGDTKSYSLTNTAGGRFAINSSTGLITVADGSVLNYEAATNHSVTVRVTDSGGLTYDETFAINLTNVNEAPTDLALSANQLTENAATGTVVGNVTGTDVDTGDTKTYSLTDTAGGRFAINSSTGVITVANGSLLNYEAASSHSVTVRVTDSGGLTYDEAFAINLTNVNEAPTGADATVTISEDTAHTLTTANFGFSDVDAGDWLSAVRIDTLSGAGTLTLSGVAVTAGQVMTVADINAGNLVFTPSADANGTGYATVTFSVRDSNNAYDAVPNSLTFDVTAVNDAPTLTAGTVSNLTVSEDAGLASLGLGGVAYSPSGGADESGQTLSYTVTAIPSATIGNVFLADGTTRVTVGSYTLADIQGMQFKPTANASGVTAFQFNVYDSGGTANGGANNISQLILITVNAVNDASTITNLSGDSLSYSEGDGAVVVEQSGDALVTDVDSVNFDTGALTVRFTAGSDSAEDVLSIQNQGTGAGQIGVSGSNITYGGVTIGTFTGGSNGSDLIITLNSGATPTRVSALVKNITYENTDTAAPTTGARTVRYVLTDGDGGTSPNYDTTVTVSGVNDAPSDLALSANSVTENAATGTVVGTITETDVDTGDTKTYSLTDTAGGRFAINSSTGVITVADGSLLNYEAASSHGVTVRVTDSGGATYDEAFTINLTNVNEAPTGADATVTINEDTSHTLTTANFGFSDVDAGDSLSAVRIDTLPGAGTLTLSGVAVTAGQVVTVADITAGNLVFTPAVNANGTGYATLTFSVRDSTNGYDAAPNNLIFDITAVNDAPVNTVPGSQNVPEDTPLAISGISVMDVDGNLDAVQLAVGNGTLAVTLSGAATISTGANGTSTLTLSGSQVDINATLATLSYQGNVNFTGNDLLTVTSRDSNAVTDVDTVAITVNPVNDAPTDLSLSANTVAENAVNGTVVGTVTGVDIDAGDAKSYSLTGTAGGRFAINSSTGVITVADGSLLNYEAASSHTVTVRVTDSGGLTYDEALAINLTNVNEAPTDLALSANQVAENAATGTVVGTVSGTDVDTGDTKTYSLTDTAGGRFAINSSTGVMTVADSSLLNYEAAPSHSVTVRVTDAGGLTRDQTFTITLANVNENPATFTGGSISLQQKAIQTEDRRLQSEGLRPPNVETVESKNVAYPAYSQDEVVNGIPQDGTRSDVSKEPPSFSPAQIVAVTRFLDEMASSEGPSPIHEMLDRHFDEVKQLLQTAEDEAPSDPVFFTNQPDHLQTVLSVWLIANGVNLVPTRKRLVLARQSEGDKPTSLENEGRQSF